MQGRRKPGQYRGAVAAVGARPQFIKLVVVFRVLREEFREVLDVPTVYPVHPRNRERAAKLVREREYRNILLAQPAGYKCAISLTNRAEKVVTNSDGLQREVFFAGKLCITVTPYNHTNWLETLVNNCNQLAMPDKADILDRLGTEARFDLDYQPFGDGHSEKKIVERIMEFFGR